MNLEQMEPEEGKTTTFWTKVRDTINRFPILFNLILMVGLGILIFWLMLCYLDRLTNHGVEVTIPEVKGLNIKVAEEQLKKEGMTAQIIDSVFDTSLTPGTVTEQNPHAGSRVKPGRTVYLTIVAYSPKMVILPDIINMSLRQGESVLLGTGFKTILTTRVESEYKDLIIDLKCNGRPIEPGQKIPINSIITLEVGDGEIELPDEYFMNTDSLLLDKPAVPLPSTTENTPQQKTEEPEVMFIETESNDSKPAPVTIEPEIEFLNND